MENNNKNVNLTSEYEARIKAENELKKQSGNPRYVKVTNSSNNNNNSNININYNGRTIYSNNNNNINGQPGKNGKGLGLIPIIIIAGVITSVASSGFALLPLGIIGFAAYKIGKKILSEKNEYVNTVKQAPPVKQEEVKKPTVTKEQAVKQEKFRTGDPDIDKMIDDKEKAVIEMRRLNAAIEDPTISAQIDHLEEVTTKILNHIIQNPSKKSQVTRFFNYYLPTTLKLLNAYDRMDDAGISGTNIDGTKGKVEDMMKTAMAAFDKQLDALFADDALDVATDITVMENLLKSEGLTDDDNITLTL